MNPRRLLAAVAGLVAATGLPYLVFAALSLVWDPEGSPADKRHDHRPTVSVVLPTYDEAEIVESKLRSICSWDYPMELVEVVVVDSSDDATPEIVESFFADRVTPSLTLIEEDERRGLAVALNEAYAAAENEVIVKTDCDSRVAADAVREAVANLADPAVGAVTGRNAEVLGGSAVERGYRDVQARIQTLESHLDSTFVFHGPFSAFERDAVVPVDEDSIADDTELALRIRRGGARVLFDPAVRYMEASHSAFRKRRRQKDRRAMGLVRLLWRQRDALFRPQYGLYGAVVLPFNFWATVVSPWLVAAGVALTTLAGVVLAGPFGLAVPAAVYAFVLAGSRDALGGLQPLYSVFDTQVSLFRAALKLLAGEGDGTWEVDAELREAYD